MKKYILNNLIIILAFSFYWQNSDSQECIVYPPKNGTLKSVVSPDISEFKTIRVIVHFPLMSVGTGNFTETTDFFNNVNQYTGYWYAKTVIDRANYYLDRNQELFPQLSFEPPVSVLPININYELAGVLFHRDDALFTSTSLSTIESYVDTENRDVAINLFFYPDAGSSFTSLGSDIVYLRDTRDSYDQYVDNGYEIWYIDFNQVTSIIHEIGHCFNLEHPKKYGNGDCCIDDNPSCLDACDDTPTYLELLGDGISDPCVWGTDEGSNNIMDYGSPTLRSWTPCQIEIAHSAIESRKELYPCGYERENLTIVTDITTDNKSYMARNVTTFNLSVSEDHRLDIDCETFKTSETFEIEEGAIFELSTAPKCN